MEPRPALGPVRPPAAATLVAFALVRTRLRRRFRLRPGCRSTCLGPLGAGRLAPPALAFRPRLQALLRRDRGPCRVRDTPPGPGRLLTRVFHFNASLRWHAGAARAQQNIVGRTVTGCSVGAKRTDCRCRRAAQTCALLTIHRRAQRNRPAPVASFVRLAV
ncbi:hypothetical protein SL003B_2437 [Polymorphum gilvum SL003B-26A1]|uniref:Uncharacterized protein n=1 Tax=Polymorphum gilvum (strain LMG 25793 / CGMCC 1.9160 / SL003B-26A1) TaxID=991905 RepID=F2J1R1_POLGS|nr:hypothetical protein SL003B_2437 [Polymorphum gilvum SL003B-26A1]